MFSLSPESDESFWPALPNSQDQNYAILYRGYKRLVNSIAEKLRKTEVLSLVYQYDLPMWYSEVGPLHEPGLALRVLSRMEGMQVFSPTRLSELAQSLKDIGRADLSETILTFQSKTKVTFINCLFIFHSILGQHKAITDQIVTSIQATEQFTRTEYGRRSYNNPRRIRRSPSDGYCNNVIPCQETIYPHTQSNSHQYPHTQSNSHQNSMEYLNQSRETTPFDVDEKDGPRSESLQKEGISTGRPTLLFNNSKDNHVGITMTLLTAETLEKQIHLLKQNLANLCLVSPDLHQSLTSAYFLTRQVSSHLNIAAANLQLTENSTTHSTTHITTHPVPDTDEPEYHLRVFNEQSPLSSPHHNRSNSLQGIEIHNTTSRSSLPETNNFLSPQQPSRPIYRTCSQPITKMSPMREMPVMDLLSNSASNVHEKEENDAFSPIDNREGNNDQLKYLLE